MKVLICGGRNYNDRERLYGQMNSLHREHLIDLVMHGGASGADSLGGDWARDAGVQYIVFPANWQRDGRAAGPIRNKRMLVEGKPDLVVAFPGGKGTAHMVKISKEVGIQTIEVS